MTDRGKNGSGESSEQFVGGSSAVNRALTKLPPERERYAQRAAGFRKFFDKQKKAMTDKHVAPQRHGRVFLFFGVILPLAAIAFEMTTHFCARNFFDPFPSANHVVLFSLIPLSNYLAWLAGRKDLSAHYGFMALISGMAMGIGCLYGLMFLPLTPISCFYSLLLGFGLLGLAPLLAIPCTWLSGKTVCRLATNKKTFFDPHQVEHIGHLIVLCMVVAVELPSTLTRMNLSLAADPATAKDGIHWLRNFGSPEVMLRACYERSGRATDILGSLYESAHPITIDQARSIFYTVTGKPFNTVPIPSSARATMQHAGNVDDIAGVNATVQDEFDLDADIAGETVSGVARGLSVSDSILTGKVNKDLADAELKWSFTFKNDSTIDREARAKILLPPGAVTTKATLTINGVERDATVMVRSVARTYYRQAVAEHKKDPLLVSMCGLDQLLVQCFPVQPGQPTKVTLTIATPLTLNQNDKAALVLPTFEERNFQFEVPTQIDLDAFKTVAMRSTASGTTSSQAGLLSTPAFHLHDKVEPAKLARFASILKFFDRDQNVHFASDSIDGSNATFTHQIRNQSYPKPEHLTILIDGSAAMQSFKTEIVQGLKGLPKEISTSIILVGDETTNLIPQSSKPGEPGYTAALSALEKFQPVGGHDDGEAMQKALIASSARKDDSILWIHAAQPITSVNTNLIKNTLENQTATRSPLLYDLQVAAGPDELLKDVDTTSSIVRVSRTGLLSDDLLRLYKAWQEPAPTQPEYSITRGMFGQHFAQNTPLAQLCAYHEILADLQSKNPSRIERAYALAGEFHLITPISSAVVIDDNPIPATTENKKADADADAAKSPFDFNLGGALEKAKDKAFSATVRQLNNLSSAASVGGSGGGQAAHDVFTSGDGETKQYNTPRQLELSSVKTQAGRPKASLAPMPTPMPSVSSLRMGSHSFTRFAHIGAEKSLQAGDDFGRFDSRARDEKLAAAAPQLQGATNGTIGPQEGYYGDQLKNAEPQKEEAENRPAGTAVFNHVFGARQNSLGVNESAPAAPPFLGVPQNSQGVFESQQAAQSSPPLFQLPDFNPFSKVSEQEKTFSAGGYASSPVATDPRYGQSNEVGRMANFGGDDAGTWLNRIVTAAFALLIIELTFLTVRRSNARKSKK